MARDEVQAGIAKLNSPEKNGSSKKKKEKMRHKHKPKPKPDEVKEEMVVDALPKEEERGKRKKKKLVTAKLSDELMGYLRTKEVMALPRARDASPRPLPIDPGVAQHMFVGQELRQEIAAQVHRNRGFDAFVLYQYRTQGYAEIQQEVTDDDDDDD